jgi:hypothetical protein
MSDCCNMLLCTAWLPLCLLQRRWCYWPITLCGVLPVTLCCCFCCLYDYRHTSFPSSSSASNGTFVSIDASAQHPLSCSLLKLRSSCFKGQLRPARKSCIRGERLIGTHD